MRISDWSSDVCSSDLERGLAAAQIDAAEADRAATVQTVQERIADAWIDVWAIQQKRTVLATLRSESVLAVQVTQARLRGGEGNATDARSEEHTSELQSLMRNSYAVFCLKKKKSQTILRPLDTITSKITVIHNLKPKNKQ